MLLRSEMASQRQQAAEVQAKLSTSVQEKLKAEAERRRQELELQHLKEQLKWHQEQLSSAKETLNSHQTPKRHADHVGSRITSGERSDYESLEEVTGLQGLLVRLLILGKEVKYRYQVPFKNTFFGQNNRFHIHMCARFVALMCEAEAESPADPGGGGETAGGSAPNGPAGSGQRSAGSHQGLHYPDTSCCCFCTSIHPRHLVLSQTLHSQVFAAFLLP